MTGPSGYLRDRVPTVSVFSKPDVPQYRKTVSPDRMANSCVDENIPQVTLTVCEPGFNSKVFSSPIRMEPASSPSINTL